MKQRRTRNIMLVVVALIWGLVIWRFMAGGKDNSGVYSSSDVMDIPMVDGDFTPDSFSLSLDYRDPFLGGFQARKAEPSIDFAATPVQVTPAPVAPKAAEPPAWTHFKYHGIVRDTKNDRRTGLLTADGRMIYVDEGMQYTGFKVIRIYADSIHIRTDAEDITLML